ncbi:MAG: M20/M25/M40 family metallo-hydrolase [Spirochaetia bacterium]|nr:M20/M25/M40 family metallo-hydrolase [Spirochaetia bacterium]
MQNRAIVAIIVFLSLAAAAIVKASFDPRPGVSDVPGEFSANRALKHLEQIARAPHPVGSDENHRVRDYILEQLRSMDIEQRVMRAASLRTVIPRVHFAGNVENIIATIPGQKPDTYLFIGHYDSVATGPGASDDGASVSSFLEVIRVLTLEKKKPVNTLVFLFSDGEEAGLLGAQAFVNDALATANVRAVFDFEARGSSGESILFQTGPGSAGLTRNYLKNAMHPFGNSLGAAVYNLLPNDTDFSVFKRRKFRGLDFAFIGDVQNYHTRLDSPANLDLRTLQHHGSNILSLASYYSSHDYAETAEDALTFFSLPGGTVHYGLWTGRMFAIVVLALAVFLFFQFHRGVRSLAWGLFAGLAWIVFAALAGFICWFVLRKILQQSDSVLGQPYNHQYYERLFLCIGFAVLFAGRAMFRHINVEWAGILLLCGLLCLAEFTFAGTGFIFLWPLLAALLSFWVRQKGVRSPGFLVALILVLPAIFLGTDLISGIFQGLSTRSGMLASSVIVFYGLSVIWLIDWFLDNSGPFVFSVFLSGIVLSIAAVAVTRQAGPRLNSLAYGFEAESARAFWFRCAANSDSFTSPFFSKAMEVAGIPAFPVLKRCLSGEMFQLGVAPKAKLQAPELRISLERAAGSVLERTVHITSPRKATSLVVSIKHSENLKGIRMLGQELPLDFAQAEGKQGLSFLRGYLNLDEWHTIVFSGLDARGIELQLTSVPGSKIEILITDRSRVIEGDRALAVPRRPDNMIPQPEFPFSDGVYLSRRFEL